MRARRASRCVAGRAHNRLHRCPAAPLAPPTPLPPPPLLPAPAPAPVPVLVGRAACENVPAKAAAAASVPERLERREPALAAEATLPRRDEWREERASESCACARSAASGAPPASAAATPLSTAS